MILYHIEFTGNNEIFEKIGITKHDVYKRFGSKTSGMYKNYNVRILALLDIPKEICRNVEQEIHKEYSDISYKPLTENFSGKTECFEPNIINIDKYKKTYNRYKNIEYLARTESNIIHYDFEDNDLKIKVQKVYSKQDLFEDGMLEEKYYSSLRSTRKKELNALIKDNKLYAKELYNGFYYKIEDNEFSLSY